MHTMQEMDSQHDLKIKMNRVLKQSPLNSSKNRHIIEKINNMVSDKSPISPRKKEPITKDNIKIAVPFNVAKSKAR